MTALTVGAQCEGYGGIYLALQRLLPVEHAWYAEFDPGDGKKPPLPIEQQPAAKLLAHHFPGVPNHGDITTFDWTTAARVAIVTSTFPCTDISLAGKQEGSRGKNFLWSTGVLPAVEALMPPLAIFENVANLLRIEDGQVFARILADLDRLGYRISWTTVGACKVGASHHRHRIFIAATLVETRAPMSDPVAHRDGDSWLPAQTALFGDHEALKWPQAGYSADGVAWEMPADVCGADGVMLPTPTATPYGNNQSPSAGAAVRPSLDGIVQMLPTPRVSDTNGAGEHGQGGLDLRTAVSMLPTPMTVDGNSAGPADRARKSPQLRAVAGMLPTPVAADSDRQSATYARGNPTLLGSLLPTPTVADSRGTRNATAGRSPGATGANPGWTLSDIVYDERIGTASEAAIQHERFGNYAAAVARQEAAFGLPAPVPTEPGVKGKPRLSPAFVEWMVGLPAGWLTGHLGRKDAIARAGNGVVPQQAAYALSTLPTFRAAAAAFQVEAVAA